MLILVPFDPTVLFLKICVIGTHINADTHIHGDAHYNIMLIARKMEAN